MNRAKQKQNELKIELKKPDLSSSKTFTRSDISLEQFSQMDFSNEPSAQQIEPAYEKNKIYGRGRRQVRVMRNEGKTRMILWRDLCSHWIKIMISRIAAVPMI